MHALIFGLQCAAYIERLDPSIYWMGMHHSRLVKRDEDGTARCRVIDPAGAAVRLGHSIAFFIGTAYGSTETAERLAKSVRAMHHTIKGTRPDGARYDADDPDWLRWNYATVVWGLATAHELYHPQPLRGKKIDRYYGEFVRVGHALGGTDLPTTKAETLDCLQVLSAEAGRHPRHGDVHRPRPADAAGRDRLGDPRHAAQVGGADGGAHQPEHRRTHRHGAQRCGPSSTGCSTATGPIPEFRQAQARVKAGTTVPHTLPTHVPGSDPVLSRDEVEHSFA